MDEGIKKMLEEAIKKEIQDLDTLEPRSDEKSKAIDNVAGLYKAYIGMLQNETDILERTIDRENEVMLNKVSDRDRYFKLGLEAAGIVLPLIFYGVWMRRGFRFEETGTYTSTTFRGLFGRFKPTGK